jgi:flagellar biosynthesis/type III secretory pathway protein FliH
MLVDKPYNLENLQICIEKLASLLPNHPELTQLFTDVIPVLLELRGVDEPELPKLKNLEELNMIFAKLLKKSRKEALIEGIEQGIEQGIEKGFEKGIEKGRKEGEILVLQRQLTRKFGTLPDYLTGKIAHASQRELESWLDKVIDADNLDGIFQ